MAAGRSSYGIRGKKDENFDKPTCRTYINAGDLLLMLAICSDAQTTGLRGTGEYVGFSAQEVQRVLPEAVSRSTNGYLQLNSDPILWTMLNAIKEQQAQIERQQKQIEGLKKLVCRSRRRAGVCK